MDQPVAGDSTGSDEATAPAEAAEVNHDAAAGESHTDGEMAA